MLKRCNNQSRLSHRTVTCEIKCSTAHYITLFILRLFYTETCRSPSLHPHLSSYTSFFFSFFSHSRCMIIWLNWPEHYIQYYIYSTVYIYIYILYTIYIYIYNWTYPKILTLLFFIFGGANWLYVFQRQGGTPTPLFLSVNSLSRPQGDVSPCDGGHQLLVITLHVQFSTCPVSFTTSKQLIGRQQLEENVFSQPDM